MKTFQALIRELTLFWEQQGCVIHQGYDLELGAGTFNPATFLRCLGPEPYKAAYVEPSRRPTDGRYGTNPNRLQHYFQYQVILKPSPADIQNVYLRSLEAIGFNLNNHDIRFVHDDWESPTLGAWGLGWEVWIDGMEVSQITYFQAFGGLPVKPVTGEITYGLERLAMYLQKVSSCFDIQWNDTLTYGDIYHRNEVEWSSYNFEEASTDMWKRHFNDYENEAQRLISKQLPLPAYDFVIKASHAFNLLDARGVISVTERTGYIGRIRDLAKKVAEGYIESREKQGYPLLQKQNPAIEKTAKTSPSATPSSAHFAKEQKEDFLLEIGSEELPASFVPAGLDNLEKRVRQLLDKERIPYKKIHTYGTPRRLAILVEELSAWTQEQVVEKRGPSLEQVYDSNGQPKEGAKGFFRSIGLSASPSLAAIQEGKEPSLQIRPIKGTDYLFATITTPARACIDILTEQLPQLILDLEFPKKMRWADLEISYARPLLWLVALYGKIIVPFSLANLTAGNKSAGHRQLSPAFFTLPEAKEYVSALKKHFVMVDREERKQSILSQLKVLEKEMQGTAIECDDVLPEVLDLVEWPQLTYTAFNNSFLKAPKELLISEMVEHQKYFPVANRDGSLKNLFVITANNKPSDQIREGNLKVLSARLSDGVFLYEQDLKTAFDKFNEKLSHVTYQKELGSVFDKVKRLVSHVSTLHQLLPIGDITVTQRAAKLCKADLASMVVYEFPELQGVMGKYYALASGESPIIAQAIEEHWMPIGENAPLPESHSGVLVSLADKIDNLLSFFSIGLKPTSSSDPYGLRRQVLGLIKTIIQGKHSLPLQTVLQNCFAIFPSHLQNEKNQVIQEVQTFLTNRIKTVFLDYQFSKDEIEASISHGVDDIYDTFCRVQALHHFRKTNPHFTLLYEVYKRAKGQLASHEKQSFQKSLLQENAEKELDSLLDKIQNPLETALIHRDYDKAYELIAQIQPALAKLFDEVKILADNPQLQKNRLALLQRVFNNFAHLLDFSKIQL